MPLSIIMWGQGFMAVSYDYAVVDWATWAVAACVLGAVLGTAWLVWSK